MAKVHVSAGQFIDGQFRPGRGKFPTYLSGGREFLVRGEEMDEGDLTDEQRADPCLRIVEVVDEPAASPSEEEPTPVAGAEEAPAVMVEPDAAPALDPVAKSGKKNK